MGELPKDRLLQLRTKIEQQRNTIEALRREGHDCPDAERQLRQTLVELKGSEGADRQP